MYLITLLTNVRHLTVPRTEPTTVRCNRDLQEVDIVCNMIACKNTKSTEITKYHLPT